MKYLAMIGVLFILWNASLNAAPPAEVVSYEQVGDGNCPDGTCPRRPVVNVPAKVAQAVADCPNGRCPTIRNIRTLNQHVTGTTTAAEAYRATLNATTA